MEKFYQTYSIGNESKNVLSRFRPFAIIISGLILAMLFMFIVDNTNDSQLTQTHWLEIPQLNATSGKYIEPGWQSIPIASGDTLISLLSENNISNEETMAVLSLPEVRKSLSHLQIGQNLQVKINDNNELLALRYPIDKTQTLTVKKTDDGFAANIKALPILTRHQTTNILINGSLYHSAREAGISQKTIMELIHIFSWKINFAKDVHPGDKIQLVYEDKYTKQRDLGAGNILAAKLIVGGKTYTAIQYKDKFGHANYYTPEGNTLKGNTLQSPVHYTRISSPFNMHRFHPILHYSRPHEGVDLAAPRGTNVKASADGVVSFVGHEGGYGNLVIVSHGHGITTRYAHLSRFAQGLHAGNHVSAGQTIAYVGSTGLANGPHLHFEVRTNNVPQNPLAGNLPFMGTTLAGNEKKAFTQQSNLLIAELSKPTSKTMFAQNHKQDSVA